MENTPQQGGSGEVRPSAQEAVEAHQRSWQAFLDAGHSPDESQVAREVLGTDTAPKSEVVFGGEISDDELQVKAV